MNTLADTSFTTNEWIKDKVNFTVKKCFKIDLCLFVILFSECFFTVSLRKEFFNLYFPLHFSVIPWFKPNIHCEKLFCSSPSKRNAKLDRTQTINNLKYALKIRIQDKLKLESTYACTRYINDCSSKRNCDDTREQHNA